MIRRPPRSTRVRSSAASDVYKRQEPHTVEVRSAEWCRSTSTNPRQRHPCTPHAAVLPPSGWHPAHSSAAGSRKHSAPVPPPRSVPISISQRFAPLGPVLSVSPAVAPRPQASGSSPVALDPEGTPVDMSYYVVPL